MVNSIKKGKSFELTVANLLTKLTEKKWQRVPCSGATATAQDVQNNIFKGDVFCEIEPFNNMVVECKITGEVFTLAVLLREKSLLWDWWAQTKEEAGENRYCLIFRYRRSPIMMLSRDLPAFPVECSAKIGDPSKEVCYISMFK